MSVPYVGQAGHWCPWCNTEAVAVGACDVVTRDELYRCACEGLHMHWNNERDFCWCDK